MLAGLAWGWRAPSPNYHGLWGSPTPSTLPLDYNTDKMNKVIVLLTDGVNEVAQGNMPGCSGSISAYQTYKCPADSDYSSYGRMSERHFGSSIDTVSEFTTELNTLVSTLCTAIKAKGIIIYSILLQVNDSTTNQLYSDCATPGNYHNSPSSSNLAGIFNTIAQQLSKLRVSR